MISKVLQLIAAWKDNGLPSSFEDSTLVAAIETAEQQRIELQDKYLPRKLMRLSVASIDLAKSQLEAHGLELIIVERWRGLWCYISVNEIEIGLLAERLITLLDMPTPDFDNMPSGEFFKTSGIPFPTPAQDDSVLYATGLNPAINCEECVIGDGNGEALPELQPNGDPVGIHRVQDELCAHNLEPQDCMFCKAVQDNSRI